MQLESNLVGSETVAGMPGPVDRVLAFLGVLLRRATAVVELRHPLGGPRQVGHDEADPRTKLAWMPIGRTADGTRQQMGDALLQDRVSRETDGVDVTFRFQISGLAKRPGSSGEYSGAIALDNWPKNQLLVFERCQDVEASAPGRQTD